MTEPYLQQTPLAALGLAARAATDAGRSDARVTLREHAFRGLIVVRGDGNRRGFRDAVARIVGAASPIAPNTVAGPVDLALGPRLLWLGPDEWLAVCASGVENRLAAELGAALADQFASVIETSDGRAAIGIEGSHARDVLMKGCTIDLHPRAFVPGQCAQTLLARAAVLIHCVGPDAFDLYVARSFAEYLWAWLEDAAGEFGIRVAP